MAGTHIPEDIIVDILSRLPVKSLCRFRCVSKRWRSVVSDPQFAKFQFKVASEKKTLSRRLLLFGNKYKIESLDWETPWHGDSHTLKKLNGPFEYGPEWSDSVVVLGSCNGLVCVATPCTLTCLYIWNPSTGFRHKLPDPGFNSSEEKYIGYSGFGYHIGYSGFGYLPATDDYKVLVAATPNCCILGEEELVEVKIFSTRAGLWRRIESPFKIYWRNIFSSAALLGETLHWVCNSRQRRNLWQGSVVYAFDLVKEEFRQMPTLDQNDNRIHLLDVDSYGGSLYGFRHGGSYGASLYGFRHGCDAWDTNHSIELWVMREYGVSDSWTKLLNINFWNQLEPTDMEMLLFPFLTTETSTVLAKLTLKDDMMEIIRIEHEDEPFVTDRLQIRDDYYRAMIIYEESLLRIPDYHAVEEYKVKETENPTHGPAKLKSRGIIASCRALFKYFWLIILIFTLAYFEFC